MFGRNFLLILAIITRCWGSPFESKNISLSSCIQVKQIFENKGIARQSPDVPINGEHLTVCQAKETCCTMEMEKNLKFLAKKDYQALLRHHTQSIQGVVGSTAIHFQDYVHQMMLKAEKKTMKVMRDLFDVVTYSVDQSIGAFYSELDRYLSNKTDLLLMESMSVIQKANDESLEEPLQNERLSSATDNFFVNLFPFVYRFNLSSAHEDESLHPDYESCLRQNIHSIKPFGDVAKMLEKDIAKTLEATKTLIAALNFGVEILNQTNSIIMNDSNQDRCYEAVLRMFYCSKCNGYSVGVKPCSGYCINVMHGCLTYYATELDAPWNGFYESLGKLVSMINSGQSVICLEDLLRGLPDRIVEAVVFFMSQNQHIHPKVRYACGQPRYTNTTVVATDDAEKTASVDWNMEEEDLNFRSTLLSNKVKQFKDSVAKSRGFYSNLGTSLCADDSYVEIKETTKCWNGQYVGEYTKSQVPATLSSQKYNPEIQWSPPSSNDPRISQLVEKLRHVRQIVLSQVAIHPESDSFSQVGNEEGSGNGPSPAGNSDQFIDDEDSDIDWKDQGSGSGEAPPVTIVPVSDNTDVKEKDTSKDTAPPPNVKKSSAAHLATPFSFFIFLISFLLSYLYS